MILNALHNKSACGCPVAHVVEVCVYADDCAVVGNVMLGVVRICVLFLCSLHLVGQASHLPRRAVIVIIVCVDVNIAASNIRCCKIVNYLLIILCQSHLNLLLYAGSKSG